MFVGVFSIVVLRSSDANLVAVVDTGRTGIGHLEKSRQSNRCFVPLYDADHSGGVVAIQ